MDEVVEKNVVLLATLYSELPGSISTIFIVTSFIQDIS